MLMGSAGSKETEAGVPTPEAIGERILLSEENRLPTGETHSSTLHCHDSPPAANPGRAKEAWSNSFEASKQSLSRETLSIDSAWEDPILGFSQEDVPTEGHRITTANDEECSRSFGPPPQESIDICRTKHDGLELEVI
jgi:hypothetical protein